MLTIPETLRVTANVLLAENLCVTNTPANEAYYFF